MPVAWKNRIVATMPALIATPPASDTCSHDGHPTCCHAKAATSSHKGWLASVMPNTRCVAVRCSPVRSRCSSNRRLPIGYKVAEASTQRNAIHAARSRCPFAWPSCSSATPTRISTPTPSAAAGTFARASR
jgi:hypothetical protein